MQQHGYPVLPKCQLKTARATPNPNPNRNVQMLSTKIVSFFFFFGNDQFSVSLLKLMVVHSKV